jgi:hypothetical protein
VLAKSAADAAKVERLCLFVCLCRHGVQTAQLRGKRSAAKQGKSEFQSKVRHSALRQYAASGMLETGKVASDVFCGKVSESLLHKTLQRLQL